MGQNGTEEEVPFLTTGFWNHQHGEQRPCLSRHPCDEKGRADRPGILESWFRELVCSGGRICAEADGIFVAL